MATTETEEHDEETEKMEKQIRMIQQGIKYGLGITFAVALLCLIIMIPVAMMAGTSIEDEDSPDGISPTALIIVSVVVPFAGIGVLGIGLYKLTPLYIQYRRTKRPHEEMFP